MQRTMLKCPIVHAHCTSIQNPEKEQKGSVSLYAVSDAPLQNGSCGILSILKKLPDHHTRVPFEPYGITSISIVFNRNSLVCGFHSISPNVQAWEYVQAESLANGLGRCSARELVGQLKYIVTMALELICIRLLELLNWRWYKLWWY